MGDKQIAAMEPSVAEVYVGITSADQPPTKCCNLNSKSLEGSEVWMQIMPGTVNMSYPFTGDPLELLRNQCVDTPSSLYLIEWNANEFAQVGFDNISPHDHACLADELFVRVLGCEDAAYELEISIEEMET